MNSEGEGQNKPCGKDGAPISGADIYRVVGDVEEDDGTPGADDNDEAPVADDDDEAPVDDDDAAPADDDDAAPAAAAAGLGLGRV